MDSQLTAQIFPHIRIVMGMVIGLGMTRLLLGAAGLVQHPRSARLSSIHLLWAGLILLELIHFWWRRFALLHLDSRTFGVFFLIAYTIVLFLLAALLFFDNLAEYAGYEDFFLRRRHWFFGLFATSFVFDLIDSLLKGQAHWDRFGIEYYIHVPVGAALCGFAIWTASRRAHLTLVNLHLLYQLSWIFRLFNTVS
ncbi:MAG: hypothetical protein MO852_08300 [Candidatus Devosia euplotis]|nr:hypothetical protein [Candidatus Devosia euplotis]